MPTGVSVPFGAEHAHRVPDGHAQRLGGVLAQHDAVHLVFRVRNNLLDAARTHRAADIGHRGLEARIDAFERDEGLLIPGAAHEGLSQDPGCRADDVRQRAKLPDLGVVVPDTAPSLKT